MTLGPDWPERSRVTNEAIRKAMLAGEDVFHSKRQSIRYRVTIRTTKPHLHPGPCVIGGLSTKAEHRGCTTIIQTFRTTDYPGEIHAKVERRDPGAKSEVERA